MNTFGQQAVGIYLVNHHIGGKGARRHIGKKHQLSGFGVDLGMRGHRGLQLPPVIPCAYGIQGGRIDFIGLMPLFQSQ